MHYFSASAVPKSFPAHDYTSHEFTEEYYSLKTSGLKYPGHLKMTQFGPNVPLLTRHT